MTAKTSLIVFYRDISKVDEKQKASAVLLSQKFNRNGRPAGETKYVSETFLSNLVYSMEVVLTNAGESEEFVDLLAQAPSGTVMVKDSKAILTQRLKLLPFPSRLKLNFYFPQPGAFPVFPSTAARNGDIIAMAIAFICNVVTRSAEVDADSWQNVARYGSDEDVLAFLQQKELQRLPLNSIA